MRVHIWLILAVGSLARAKLDPGKFCGCKEDKSNKLLVVESEVKNGWIFFRCVQMEDCSEHLVCNEEEVCDGEFSFLRKFVVSKKGKSGFEKHCCKYVPNPTVQMEKHCYTVKIEKVYGLQKPGPRGRRPTARRRNSRRRPSLKLKDSGSEEGGKDKIKPLQNVTEAKAAVASGAERKYKPKSFFAMKDIKEIKDDQYEVTTCQISCKEESSEENKESEEEKEKEKKKEKEKNEEKKEENRETEKKEETKETERKQQTRETEKKVEEGGPKTIKGNVQGRGGWGGCIGGDGLVETPNGPKRVDQLQLGDQVLVRGGGSRFRPVKWMHHFDHNSTGHFLIFRTENGREIALTPLHLVLHVNCPADQEKFAQYVFAERLSIVSCLKTRDNKTGMYKNSKIISMQEVEQKGLYAPITETGNIMVNGVVASCYSYLENQALVQSVHDSLFWVSSVLEKVLFWLKLSQTPEPEIPFLIQMLQKFALVVVPNPRQALVLKATVPT